MWQWMRIVLVVLCAMIGIAAGWVHCRSYRLSSVGHWYGEKSWVGIYCARGKIVVGIGRERIDAVIKHDFYERPVKAPGNEVEFDDTFRGGRWLGVGYYQSNSPTVGYVLLPIWVIWTLASVPIVVAICKRLRKSVRQSSNLCVNCGYDLRGSGGRCPECGKEVVGQAPSCERPVRSVLV
ncbi:MAG TPA: hypothetical protein VGP94_17165 [Tepidisphaeraceae bacterium]|jgi:hypothetical protein|nr:hypothetical protein [Tepidisphaeraceae bacterium]